ncbi:ABC transporter substrate-binding protein [Nocardioides speluncae]|uniref:ABC transporter substrate-binding protein n=1 Tax=Nocardioides speluncae TaxID=2670337 RepID=UPI000D692124|nr:ABC transporter substrate-binding protein [Nocardioides speluncae]
MQVRRILAATVATGAVLLVGACAGDDLAKDEGDDSPSAGSGGGEVRLTGQNFPEATLMASIYEQLLTAEGYDVTVDLVGTRDIYMQEFPGDYDIVPEYVGGIVDYLNTTKNGPESEPLTTSDAAESITNAQSLLDAEGITLLAPSAAADTNAFFVTEEYSESERVTKLSDLEGKEIVLAGAPDCKGRPDCEGGLTDVYGIKVTKILPLGYGGDSVNRAVIDGEAQLGETATTDGTLESQSLVLLEDDKQIQPAQNLIPAVSSDFLAEHPDLEETLNALMAALDTDRLTDLNGQVAVERAKPEDVAKDFLEGAGLI